jgi:Mor family transcriptional regulator
MEITVGELKKHLESFSDDTVIYFGGLDFYRTKPRGDKLVQIEFNQQVYKTEDGKVVIEN